MIFPLDFLSETERRHPGLLAQLERKAGSIEDVFTFMAQKGVDSGEFNGLYPLLRWKRDKVSYSFDTTISIEILEQTEEPDFKIPVMFLSRLPYECIAVRTTPLTISDVNNPSREYENYTGNAFIWVENDHLISAWESDSGRYTWSSLKLVDGFTLDDSYEASITDKLEMEFSSDEIQQFKEMFHVEHFREITQLNKDGSDFDISSPKHKTFNNIMYLSGIEETLAQRLAHIVLYLNASNADIQAAEEKLKASAWASIADVPQTEDQLPRTARRRALREIGDTKVFDVGYRDGAKFRKAFSDSGNAVSGTGRTVRYHKRRAHLHHFWVGPRNGPIAEDIMNPAPGERGLVLYWLPSTEIHKELADDLPTLIKVDENSGDLSRH